MKAENEPKTPPDETAQDQAAIVNAQQPFRMKLPGFLADEEVGLGDLIKRATSFVGIKPCGGCRQRAEALNRRLKFSGRRRQ